MPEQKPGTRILREDHQAVDDQDGGAQIERAEIHTCLVTLSILAN